MAGLNVAVIGCGGIGGTHLTRWSEVSGAQVAVVCDVDAAAATRAASEFDAEAHTDWRAVMELRGLTAVDICTPPDEHTPIALAALNAGLHVLCEKPLARTAAEARRVVDLAEERNLRLMTGFCHRFDPMIVFAKELVDNDDLGRIVMFRSRLSGHFETIDTQWFADPEVSGGGVLLDMAIHGIDLFRHLAGEVVSATGQFSTVNPRLSVEDSAALVLKGEKGAIGVVEASWSTPGGRNILELYGTAGSCFVDYDEGRVRYKTADMAVWETRETGAPDRFQREISHFVDAVRGLQPLLVTGHDGLRALEIVEMITCPQ
jgi:UDP-N-acetylglucosamine 3-dehydrogenase